jgi:hypothetical protein
MYGCPYRFGLPPLENRWSGCHCGLHSAYQRVAFTSCNTANHPGLLQMMVLEHDFPEGTEHIDSHGMLGSEGRSEAMEGLIQQTDGSIDLTGAPERQGQLVDYAESMGMI